MSRGGRLVAAVITAAVLGSGVGGCARFDAKPVQVAPPAVAGDCVVGSWKQTEGWQRIETEDVVTDLRLIEGGRTFEIKADGTATARYTIPAHWQNKSYSDDLDVIYEGVVTMKYTAVDGDWTETADVSKSTSQIKYNGTQDIARPGAANRVTKATYVCSETVLIISNDVARQVYQRV